MPIEINGTEKDAAAKALDTLYAKYGCEADGMWAFGDKCTQEDLDEAYRLRAIVWSITDDSCCECFDAEEHSRNIECDGCGGTCPDCICIVEEVL